MRRHQPLRLFPSDDLIDDEFTIVSITGEEVLGKKSSLADVEALLRTVPRPVARNVLSVLGSLYDSENIKSWVEIERVVLRQCLLGSALCQRVAACERLFPASGQRVLLSRPLLLLALRLAHVFCPETPEQMPPEAADRDGKAHVFQLGEALLRLSDLLPDYGAGGGHPSTEETAAMLLPFFDELNQPRMAFSLDLAYEMIQDPLWNTEPILVLARERFRKETQVDLEDVLRVSVAVISRIVSTRTALRQTGSPDFSPTLSFRNIRRNARETSLIEHALEVISVRYSEVPARLPAHPESILTDFSQEPFRSHPLIRLSDDVFLCTDATFLCQRLTVGTRWMLAQYLSSKERELLAGAWGTLFERAMTRRLHPALKSAYIPHPSSSDGEVTDALVDYGEELSLIEFKAITLREDTKHGADGGTLLRELRSKLLKVKDGKEPQIVRALRGLHTAGFFRARRSLPRVLYPVIVSLDPAACGPLLAPLLNKTLSAAVALAQTTTPRLPRHPRIERLTILSPQDAVRVAYLCEQGFKLTNLLRWRFQADPEGRKTFNDFLYRFMQARELPDLQPEAGSLKLFADAKAFWRDQGAPELLTIEGL